MKWPSIVLETKDGLKPGIAPLIISASRSTDIPAFHSEWFAKRLAAGYCKWVNPFNRQSQYVSFANTKAFVFWTKNAAPMMSLLPSLDNRHVTYYFQFTLNDYDADGLEPHVPPLGERVATFRKLSETIGKSRVIWRFDPLLLTETITEPMLIDKVKRVGDLIHPFTEKLVISFADIASYVKVRRNFAHHGIRYQEFTNPCMQDLGHQLAELARAWGIAISSCCEAIDLSVHGIGHNRCIDDALLLRLSSNDPALLSLLAPRSRLGGLGDVASLTSHLKDAGQRETCGCVVSKDIGQYDTCAHLCRYCYANTSASIVNKNVSHLSIDGESICPT